MLTTLTIKVEILPGTSIEHAAESMWTLADVTQCRIEATLNGLSVAAWPGRNPESIAIRYLDRPKD